MTIEQESRAFYGKLLAAVLTSVGLSTGIQYKTEFRHSPFTGEQGAALEKRIDYNSIQLSAVKDVDILMGRRIERIQNDIEHLEAGLLVCQEMVKEHNKSANVWIRQIEQNKHRLDYYLGKRPKN